MATKLAPDSLLPGIGATWAPLTARGHTVSLARARNASLVLLPFLILGAVALIDVLGGSRTGVLPLLIMGPGVAAIYGGVWLTTLAGGAACATCGGLDTYQHLFPSRQQDFVFAAVVGAAATAVVIGTVRQRHQRELADVRTIAEIAQQVLLRPVPAKLASPVTIAVRYISAMSGARIGGDLYEAMSTDAGVRLIVGDVQGKGLPAVKTAAVVLGTFREECRYAADLTEIAARIEESLLHALSDEEFVTAVLAEVSTDGSVIHLLSCGHPPPLQISGTGVRFAESALPSLPLGLARLADVPRDPVTLPLRPGDQILFYTDGVSEARDPTGAFFPLARLGATCCDLDPEEGLRRLSEALIRHAGHPLDDDAAMLLVRRDGI